MVNRYTDKKEVEIMSRSKLEADWWDMILDDLILESDPPPTKYIKDAVIVTKSGARFKISAEDFAQMVAREKEIGYENSEIFSCSLNIDFSKIKRDVNRWANKFIFDIEAEAAKLVAEQTQKRTKKASPRKPSALN
jgi:hypothetical protein